MRVEATTLLLAGVALCASSGTRGATATSPLVGVEGETQRLQIDHVPVGCVVAEQHPAFEARLEPAANVREARLHFRPAGGRHWYSVAMEETGEAFVGVLPKPKKSLKGLDYYIEVTGSRMETSRTEEYSPVVVAGVGACADKKVAAGLAAAAVVVAPPPGMSGAALVPAGFSSSGVTAGTTPTAASTGASGGGSAGATAAGGGIGATGLVIGGLVVAGGAGVAVAAAGGGGGSDSSSGSSRTSAPVAQATPQLTPEPTPEPTPQSFDIRGIWDVNWQSGGAHPEEGIYVHEFSGEPTSGTVLESCCTPRSGFPGEYTVSGSEVRWIIEYGTHTAEYWGTATDADHMSGQVYLSFNPPGFNFNWVGVRRP